MLCQGGLNEILNTISLLFLPTVSTEFINDTVIILTPGQLLNKNGNAIMPERCAYKTIFLTRR